MKQTDSHKLNNLNDENLKENIQTKFVNFAKFKRHSHL